MRAILFLAIGAAVSAMATMFCQRVAIGSIDDGRTGLERLCARTPGYELVRVRNDIVLCAKYRMIITQE